ncbi:hypothetical protein PENTCL1PPCAC_12195, partial [Pristionchus entomophagus]
LRQFGPHPIMLLNSLLVILATSLPLAASLMCLHNSTVTNAIYSDKGVLIRAYTSYYNLGLLECGANLTRCVNFKSMDVSFFSTLDAAQEDTIFNSLIKGNNGQVVGQSCMSEADCNKIKAQEAEDCMGEQAQSCFCSTDECTGASGMAMTLASLITVLIYLITTD